ncbi:MAG: hypothetical protein M3O50_20620 [Myxococcota bacterium]|nr:hypothetical protein [Myxococcota bacterium]
MSAGFRFDSLALVGWFDGKEKRQDAHRRGLAEARGLVDRYRPAGSKYFELEGIPTEFRGAVLPHLENLAWHLENTGETDIGDPQSMREVGEALGVLHVLCSGRFAEETQRNFRTQAFDASVERLAELVEHLTGTCPACAGSAWRAR